MNEVIARLVTELKDAGYVVYVAEKGTYGFYTDENGERVVSFGLDLGNIKWSGNYISERNSGMGTGWRMQQDTFYNMLYAPAPHWATWRGGRWRYATEQDQLDRYGATSRYTKQ